MLNCCRWRSKRCCNLFSSLPGAVRTLCQLQHPRLGRCPDDTTRAAHCYLSLVRDSVFWVPKALPSRSYRSSVGNSAVRSSAQLSAATVCFWLKVTALTGLSALGSELRVRSGFGNSGWVSHSTPAAGRAGRIVTWISSQPGMAWTLCRLQLPRLGRCLDDATRAGHCRDCLLVLDSVSWAPTVPSLALAQISPKGCPHEPRCFGSEAAETPDEGTLNGGR